MAKSALWRITSVDTRGQDLVLSRLRLLASSTRVDSGAVLTCTAAPVSGALADLLDDSAASCRFAAADVSAPGFQIVFTLPAEQEVDGVELGLVSVPVSPVALALEFLADGIYTVRSDFRGVETAGAPKIQQVGEVIAGTPQQGYIVALRAGSAYPEYNAFDQGAATWAGNFGQTIDIGLFANAGTNPGDTGVQPQKTINQFSIHDTWNLSSLNGFYNGDIANLDIEFLRNDGGVVAAIRLKRGAEYSTDMFFGASLGALTKASQTGTFGWPSGDITFKSQAMAWMPSAANSNNHAAWSYPAQMSEVTSVRFSNARAMSNYGGGWCSFCRDSSYAYMGSGRLYRRIAVQKHFCSRSERCLQRRDNCTKFFSDAGLGYGQVSGR